MVLARRAAPVKRREITRAKSHAPHASRARELARPFPPRSEVDTLGSAGGRGMSRVLVVDDDVSVVGAIGRGLKRSGFAVTEAYDADTARARIRDGALDLVVTDVRLSASDVSDRSGIDVLRLARRASLRTVVLTGADDPALVRDVMVERPDLCILKRELEIPRLATALRGLLPAHAPTDVHPALRALVGQSLAMREVRAQIEAFARRPSAVLITGENGTGKELVATALHALSGVQGRFEAVNVCELPTTLFESLLFGHTRGAFSGAEHDHPGAFERADGGTLFLDEIGELPLTLQPKLLRAIESQQVRRIGARTPTDVRARLICATNVPLREQVAQGRFREDLLHRLDVLRIHLPPLRARTEDISILLSTFGARVGIRFASDAVDWLATRAYPGNVRELGNVVHRLAALVEGEVDLAAAMRATATPSGERSPLPERLRSLERTTIEEAMRATNGNKAEAARRLGISRFALIRRLAPARIVPPPGRHWLGGRVTLTSERRPVHGGAELRVQSTR